VWRRIANRGAILLSLFKRRRFPAEIILPCVRWLASYSKTIRHLPNAGLLSKDVVHRTSKYLNNIVEADHGALKRMIRPTRSFQRMKTASTTLKGFEVMRMVRRGHCLPRHAGATGESCLVNNERWCRDRELCGL